LLEQYEAEGAVKQGESFEKLYDAYRRQNHIYQLAALISPRIAVQTVSMAFAGTDTAHHRHFAESAEEYRYRMAQRLNEDLINTAQNLTRDEGTAAYKKRERELYESVPPLAYAAPDWRWTIKETRLSFGLLLLWFGGIALTAFFATRRMRID